MAEGDKSRRFRGPLLGSHNNPIHAKMGQVVAFEGCLKEKPFLVQKIGKKLLIFDGQSGEWKELEII